MNEALTALMLVGLACLWFCVPLIPTIVELRRRSDAKPLVVDRDHDGEIRHFARRFKAYLESAFGEPSLRERIGDGIPLSGVLTDGTAYRLMGSEGSAALHPTEAERALILFSGPTATDDGLIFPKGVYAAAPIVTGRETLIRSLYGESNVRLRERSVISRWIHVADTLTVEKDCVLHGRASADHLIVLDADVEFERLHAPRVLFEPVEAGNGSLTKTVHNLTLFGARQLAPGCFRVDGDLEAPPGSLIRGDFVVQGSVKIGGNCRIEGSLKSHGEMDIGEGAIVEGSVVSSHDLSIGPHCRIRGPVVASQRLSLRGGCQIGSESFPTSAIAPSIRVNPGVLVYGTVWAREHGLVERFG